MHQDYENEIKCAAISISIMLKIQEMIKIHFLNDQNTNTISRLYFNYYKRIRNRKIYQNVRQIIFLVLRNKIKKIGIKKKTTLYDF